MVDDVAINTLVDKVLEEVDCTENRASKMDVDDLLKYAISFYSNRYSVNSLSRLLSAFHESGIHFS